MSTPFTRSITEDQRTILSGLNEPMSYVDLHAKFENRFEPRRVLGVLKALSDRGLVSFKPVKKGRGLWTRNEAGERVLAKYDSPIYKRGVR